MTEQSIISFIMDNLKNIFYPEEWLSLDLRVAKSGLLALLVLDRHGELTMSQFSDYLHMPMNTATGIINRLVNDGYVLRERSETDRRLVLIKPTETGREITGKFKDFIGEYVTLIDEALTQEEKNAIFSGLLKIMALLKTKAALGNTDDKEAPAIQKIEIE